MSVYMAGRMGRMMAKEWGGKVRFWNIFLSLTILFSIGITIGAIIDRQGALHPYQTEQTFVSHQHRILTTDQGRYKTAKHDVADIPIEDSLDILESGDKLQITLNSLTGKICEIHFENKLIYQESELVSVVEMTICGIIFNLFFVGGSVFLLICVNTKHPKRKFIKKLQKSLMNG